ncbi:hypothetical protein [Bradyrhizobium genosp. P]|uniref:hypothetical protein n=1 Tax=Bradyrhizobium genosp. P TaxID=83641 RepID=UPI003CE983A2
MPIGAETKNRTFVQQPPAQRSGLILSGRDTERLQRTFRILWKVSLCVRVATRRRQSLSRDYFFFLEVFFATFLVAAFAVFFAFFAFLAMSSSLKSGSVNMHTPSIDMHNVETISQMQN